MNAFSTLVELLADVSMNSIPSESANSLNKDIQTIEIKTRPDKKNKTFACSYGTARFDVRSDLFPTRSLFTFSDAYLEREETQFKK